MAYKIELLLICVLGCLLLACSQPEEVIEATQAPISTATTAPALAATATTTAVPTSAAPTASAVPTDIPQPTATAQPTAVPLSIQAPPANETVPVGSELIVSGQANIGAEDVVTLLLRAGAHSLITETVAIDSSSGSWTASFTVPMSVSGPAQLIASTPTQLANVPITLAFDSSDTPPISLARPAGGTAVAGYTLFFSGTVGDSIDGEVTIAVLGNNCTEFAARQSFTVPSDATWQGWLVLPAELSGAACAVAYTGTFGAAGWREAQVPLTIIAPEDEGAARISLGNSGELVLKAGETASLFGSAVNAPNNIIEILIELDVAGVPPEPVLQTAVETNSYGFWEADLLLPPDKSGTVLITLFFGSGDDYQEVRIPAVIMP